MPSLVWKRTLLVTWMVAAGGYLQASPGAAVPMSHDVTQRARQLDPRFFAPSGRIPAAAHCKRVRVTLLLRTSNFLPRAAASMPALRAAPTRQRRIWLRRHGAAATRL